MRKVSGVLSVLVVLTTVLFITTPTFASQPYSGGQHTQSLVTRSIDDSNLVTLSGNTRSEANAANDRGAVADDLPMEHLQLVLQRPAALEAQLENLIDGQQRKGSPQYHKWLTAKQFGEKFGVSPQDISQLRQWLESHGFRVDSVLNSGMVIEFSGNAGQIREAFHTQIHNLDVDGKQHIANMSDPKIPAALAGVVKGVQSLHDFMPHSMIKRRPQFDFTCPAADCGTTTPFYLIAPPDLATIYNLNPAFASGNTGAGQTVVVIEDTNILNASDVSTFRTAFGLSGYSGTFTQINPAGALTCTNPGVNGDEDEATLDAEWSGAAAPDASIVLASCEDTTAFGGLIALENILNGSSLPNVVSISYGECESENGATANASYNSTYQQAVSEGVSVFVSSGDEGAASCDANRTTATHGIAVSGFASSQYDVAVGGTDYGDTYETTVGGPPLSTYWGASNSATYGSALSYIPEIPWNDSCASQLLYSSFGYATGYGPSGFCASSTAQTDDDYLTTGSGSGGPSECATGTASSTTRGVVSGTCAGWPKPSYQSVFGNPSDGVRDIPDVSLFAANGVWAHFYVYCDSDPSYVGDGSATACDYTNADDVLDLGAGGTSFSSPIMAGIQALVNQANGGGYAGNPNTRYYALAGLEYGATGDSACNSSLGPGADSGCVFYDVTLGDMDVNCTPDVSRGTTLGTFNCFGTSGSGSSLVQGALSVSSSTFEPAYGSNTGWDFPTGIGTVNAYNLIQNWTTVVTTTGVTSSLNPSEYGQGMDFTATVTPAIGSTETGSVQFYADGNLFDTETLNSGTATSVSISTLNAGTHVITATYSGDSNYSGSSTTLSGGQVVNAAEGEISVALSTGTNPSNYGNSVTFTATVTSDTGAVKGRKTTKRPRDLNGAVSWSANTGCASSPVSGNPPQTATCTTTALGGGSDTVTATYTANDSNHTTASGSASQTVNPANQTITVTTSAPSTAIDNSSFTVVASASSGLPVSFASSGSCTNSGGTFTITAGSRSGSLCSESVSQTGNNDYNPASVVSETTTVVAQTMPTVSFTGPSPLSALYGASFSVTASSVNDTSIPVITTSTGSICQITGTTTNGTSVTATVQVLAGAAVCDLSANWAINNVYKAAVKNLAVRTLKVTPTESFTGAPSSADNGSSFTVTATSNSATTPTITTGTPAVCSIGSVTGNGPGSYQASVTMMKSTGTCKMKATWAADTDYLATSGTQSTTAEPATSITTAK